jgi:hypothetical protein
MCVKYCLQINPPMELTDDLNVKFEVDLGSLMEKWVPFLSSSGNQNHKGWHMAPI